MEVLQDPARFSKPSALAGVIALTRCGSRTSGFACGVWLIIFGILAKIGAFFVRCLFRRRRPRNPIQMINCR